MDGGIPRASGLSVRHMAGREEAQAMVLRRGRENTSRPKLIKIQQSLTWGTAQGGMG